MALLGTFSPGLAHAEGAPPPPSAQLGDPHTTELVPLPRPQLFDPGELELSQRSMGGPGFEVGAGGVIMLFTPLVAMMVIFANEPPWFECDDWFGETPEVEQQQCQERHDRQQRAAVQKGAVIGVVQGSIGLALVAHGATRIHRIRQARKHIELEAANLTLTQGGAVVGLRGSF